MFHRIAAALDEIHASAMQNLVLVLWLGAALWVIHALNAMAGYGLNRFGLVPRTALGLRGIVFSHFLHANWRHLFLNTFPFLVLSILVLVYGLTVFLMVTAIVMLVSGTLTWLLARRGLHIGASAVIMGYWGFLLLNAWHDRSVMSLLLAVVCLLYFGGLVWCLAPAERSSWEGHLTGMLGGFTASYALTVWLSRS